MKMMLICENDKERKDIAALFEAMAVEKAKYGDVEANYLEGGVCSRVKGCTDIYPTENPVVYALQKGIYTVYNFKTMKKTENVEGNLAGLANLPEEDFPAL